MMISALLVPQLLARFPDRGLRVSGDKPPVVLFPAIHPDVGDIQIIDDGEELTVYIGSNHAHFGNYDNQLPLASREQLIVDQVIAELTLIFSEQIEIYRTWWGGGWGPRGTGSGIILVWSGPVK